MHNHVRSDIRLELLLDLPLAVRTEFNARFGKSCCPTDLDNFVLGFAHGASHVRNRMVFPYTHDAHSPMVFLYVQFGYGLFLFSYVCTLAKQ